MGSLEVKRPKSNLSSQHKLSVYSLTEPTAQHLVVKNTVEHYVQQRFMILSHCGSELNCEFNLVHKQA